MKIAIDAREFRKGRHTGLRAILYDFLSHAGDKGHEFVFFCNQYTDLDGIPCPGEKVVLHERITFFWDQWHLPAAIKKSGADVFFSPYIKTPLRRVCPYVNAISDVIPLVRPKRGGIKGFLEKAHFFAYSFISGRRAAAVITLSCHAKAEVCRALGISPGAIEVIYPSVDIERLLTVNEAKEAQITDSYGLDAPYILYAGNFKAHKNIKRLIQAYALLPDEIRERYRLVLAGGSAKEVLTVEKEIHVAGLKGRVAVVANLPHEDIPVLMKKAALFVFPSLAEGFGIPPVESMALGIPVAASAIEPMKEVLREAAVFFDPYDPRDIAEKICSILLDDSLRDICIKKGEERAEFFAPEKMSARMMEVIEGAARSKVLLISSDLAPRKGGMAKYLSSLWKLFKNDEAVILTARISGSSDKSGDMLSSRVVVRYPLGGSFPARGMRTLILTWHALSQTRRFRIRSVHCGQVLSSGIAGFLIKKTKDVPYMVYVYSADIAEFEKNLLSRHVVRMVLGEAEKIIACSDFAKKTVVAAHPSIEDKTLVLTPGIDPEEFSPSKIEVDIRKKYSIPGEGKVLLTVARLVPRKGHDRVIKAVAELKEKYPDLYYVIVGDGPEREHLKAIATSIGIRDKVIFAGPVPENEIAAFYNTCDVFIMVPRHIKRTGDVEGFGIVFLEANACAKPVIAGNSGGVSEAVMDGHNGVLVDPENDEEISNTIDRFIGDREMARSMGERGFSLVLEKFKWEDRFNKLKNSMR
jgi:phosphatidyl-myo-inositol dimannoside synthase